MAILMPSGKQQFFSNAGVPLSGGQLFTYAAGTSTPKATYQDAGAATPNSNPITLDSRGEAVVYWDGVYKLVLQDSLGNTIWTVDNYSTIGGAAAIQQNAYVYGVDSGGANSYLVNYFPAITSVVDGMVLHFRAKTLNTGVSQLTVNSLAAATILGGDHANLTGGEIAANGDVSVQWNSVLNGGTGAWVLLNSSGGYIKSPTPTTGDRSNKVATTQMFASEFAASKTTNGYCKLPNGLILQWGDATFSNTMNFGGSVNFPIAFPNAALSIVGQLRDVSAGSYPTNIFIGQTPTTTSFVYTMNGTGSTTGAIRWMAIGW